MAAENEVPVPTDVDTGKSGARKSKTTKAQKKAAKAARRQAKDAELAAAASGEGTAKRQGGVKLKDNGTAASAVVDASDVPAPIPMSADDFSSEKGKKDKDGKTPKMLPAVPAPAPLTALPTAEEIPVAATTTLGDTDTGTKDSSKPPKKRKHPAVPGATASADDSASAAEDTTDASKKPRVDVPAAEATPVVAAEKTPDAAGEKASTAAGKTPDAPPGSSAPAPVTSVLARIGKVNTVDPRIHASFSLKQADLDAMAADNVILNQGRWSDKDVAILKQNIADYEKASNTTVNAAFIGGMQKKSTESVDFYKAVSFGIARPLKAVYRKVARMFIAEPESKGQKYSEKEIEELKAYVKVHGHEWSTIGKKMGRTAESVRDKYRAENNVIKNKRWTELEEKALAAQVYKCTNTEPGDPVTRKISWEAVAAGMEGRAPHQCLKKWVQKVAWKERVEHDARRAMLAANAAAATAAVTAEATGDGTAGDGAPVVVAPPPIVVNTHWRPVDNALLVDCVKGSGVADESEISWPKLQQSFKGTHRTGFVLQIKWKQLLKRCKIAAGTPFPDILAKLTEYTADTPRE
eukprot:m.392691 g.392691  ORF g.392691 m.392691 type:complete len:579 (-) comp21082_c0_seq1:144-1880(-)